MNRHSSLKKFNLKNVSQNTKNQVKFFLAPLLPGSSAPRRSQPQSFRSTEFVWWREGSSDRLNAWKP
ncbi:hypothetical protein [Coleofasciculus chthonoplastes]|uniref:hypothetical protein n=1 Tax=Coleofasciculus chthonoplastes TaxID=64178 RepID=UPI0032FD71B7